MNFRSELSCERFHVISNVVNPFEGTFSPRSSSSNNFFLFIYDDFRLGFFSILSFFGPYTILFSCWQADFSLKTSQFLSFSHEMQMPSYDPLVTIYHICQFPSWPRWTIINGLYQSPMVFLNVNRSWQNGQFWNDKIIFVLYFPRMALSQLGSKTVYLHS